MLKNFILVYLKDERKVANISVKFLLQLPHHTPRVPLGGSILEWKVMMRTLQEIQATPLFTLTITGTSRTHPNSLLCKWTRINTSTIVGLFIENTSYVTI